MKKLFCLLVAVMLLCLTGISSFALEEEFVPYSLGGFVYEVPTEWTHESKNDARNLHVSADGKTSLEVSFVADSEGSLESSLDRMKSMLPDADMIELQMDAFEGVLLTGETVDGAWINAACIASDAGCLTLVYFHEGAEGQSEEFDTILNRVSNDGAPYIGNRNTKKFHYASCSSVDDMKEKNKVELFSRDAAIDGGYVPCKRCDP